MTNWPNFINRQCLLPNLFTSAWFPLRSINSFPVCRFKFVTLSSSPNFVWHCTKNLIFTFQMFWKDDLPKKIALEYDLSSSVIKKDHISFFRKYDFILEIIFFEKQQQQQQQQQRNIFFVYSVKMYFFSLQIWYYPSTKKQRRYSPEKYTLRRHFSYHWKRRYSSKKIWYSKTSG